jgi:chromosome segregation ATPase
MSNTIEQSELDELKSLNSSVSELKSMIADCEVQVVRLKRMKDSAVSELESVGEKLSSVQGALREKYGDIVVNLKTGEYTQNG